MDTQNTRIEIAPNTQSSIDTGLNSLQQLPLVEWSVLSSLCLVLVRSFLKEYFAAQKAERELTAKLVENLVQKNTP